MSRSFNGTSDYLECGAAVVTAVPITLSCWSYLEDTAIAHTLMSIGDAAADTKVYLLNSAGGGTTASTVAVGGATGSAAGSALPAGVWAHACGVFASAIDRKVFVNGVLGASNTTSIVLGTPTATAIGTRYTAGVRGAFFDGLIAEVAIWSAALSAADVKRLSRGVSPLLIDSVNLRAYWPLVGRDTPELNRKGRNDLTVVGAKSQLVMHPVLQPLLTRRPRALDAARLLVRDSPLLTGVMGMGAVGSVIPLPPPQQPGAIVFNRQLG